MEFKSSKFMSISKQKSQPTREYILEYNTVLNYVDKYALFDG